MNLTPSIAVSILLLASAPLAAQTIYKHVDAQGKVTYSNEPIKGGKKVDLPPLSTVTLPKPANLKPEQKAASTPAIEAGKAQHKKQLQEAISAEEKALEQAKSKRKEDDVPELTHSSKTVVGKNGKPSTLTEIRENPRAYEEKIKKLDAAVTEHEKKLAGLKAELQNLDTKP